MFFLKQTIENFLFDSITTITRQFAWFGSHTSVSQRRNTLTSQDGRNLLRLCSPIQCCWSKINKYGANKIIGWIDRTAGTRLFYLQICYYRDGSYERLYFQAEIGVTNDGLVSLTVVRIYPPSQPNTTFVLKRNF